MLHPQGQSSLPQHMALETMGVRVSYNPSAGVPRILDKLWLSCPMSHIVNHVFLLLIYAPVLEESRLFSRDSRMPYSDVIGLDISLPRSASFLWRRVDPLSCFSCRPSSLSLESLLSCTSPRGGFPALQTSSSQGPLVRTHATKQSAKPTPGKK